MQQAGKMIGMDSDLELLLQPLDQPRCSPGSVRLIDEALQSAEMPFRDPGWSSRTRSVRQPVKAPNQELLNVLAHCLFMVSQVSGYAGDIPPPVCQPHHLQPITGARGNATLMGADPQFPKRPPTTVPITGWGAVERR